MEAQQELPFARLTGDGAVELHFEGGAVATVSVHPTTAKLAPVATWRYEVRDGRIWLFGCGTDSVHVQRSDGSVLAHEFVKGWRLVD